MNDAETTNFILEEIVEDLRRGRFGRPVRTRFPPEPNGFMHLGHALASLISYRAARKFDGIFGLRFDDTNPATEEERFTFEMKKDLEWLIGQDLDGRVTYTSDYFDELYGYAVRLTEQGLAYVDDLSTEDIRVHRGDFHTPGTPSVWRDREVGENLDLLARMRDGEFAPGSRVLRAKIDLGSPNMNMRDPLIYRVAGEGHYRAGGWSIYPMYDFAHPLSDAIEGVTHSLCGKEFEDHRPLYDWFLEKLAIPEPPRQIEFAEVSLRNAILSKRYLSVLVAEGKVDGWDDPRLPTIGGMRRAGYPAAAIREFCESLGVSRSTGGVVERTHLDFYVREMLQKTSHRRMGVVRPVKVVIENYPADETEWLEFDNLPGGGGGTRELPFSSEIYIEREDFMEDPPSKYFRLAPGREVRLRSAYIIKCTGFDRDPETGEVVTVRATYDPETKSGAGEAPRKVKGTIHWVCARSCARAELRLYDELMTEGALDELSMSSVASSVSSTSLETVPDACVEPSVIRAPAGTVFQFERVGYFCVDPASTEASPVLNRTIPLREAAAKKQLG